MNYQDSEKLDLEINSNNRHSEYIANEETENDTNEEEYGFSQVIAYTESKVNVAKGSKTTFSSHLTLFVEGIEEYDRDNQNSTNMNIKINNQYIFQLSGFNSKDLESLRNDIKKLGGVLVSDTKENHEEHEISSSNTTGNDLECD